MFFIILLFYIVYFELLIKFTSLRTVKAFNYWAKQKQQKQDFFTPFLMDTDVNLEAYTLHLYLPLYFALR